MPSVGEQLRSAREAQGKSLEDIGGELKIRADHVAALEVGDFDKFDAPIFVRGFVRSYCRIVKLDPNALVVHLNQELGGTQTLSTDPALPGKKGFVDGLTLFLSRLNWTIWLPLIVLISIAVIVLFVVNSTQAQREELRSGDWIDKLPPTQYTPVRTNVLNLELPLPPVPVKPPPNNAPASD
jgi:cytoskeletal protein RodZ